MARGLVLFALMTVAISCSTIEEDRKGCPCWYKIDFSQVDTQIEKLYLWFFDQQGNPLLMDTLYSSRYGDIYEVELKRGTVGFHVWGNVLENTTLESPHASEPFLKKGEGSQADPLYSYSKVLDTWREDGNDVVFVKREYADLDIVLKGGTVQGSGFWIKLDCGTSGRYIDGRFLEEGISLVAETSADSNGYSAKFRLLRQKSLARLKMSVGSSEKAESYIIEDFPIGELMLGSGYDMDADNLQDIMVVVDVSAGRIILCTEDWKTVIYVDVRL